MLNEHFPTYIGRYTRSLEYVFKKSRLNKILMAMIFSKSWKVAWKLLNKSFYNYINFKYFILNKSKNIFKQIYNVEVSLANMETLFLKNKPFKASGQR